MNAKRSIDWFVSLGLAHSEIPRNSFMKHIPPGCDLFPSIHGTSTSIHTSFFTKKKTSDERLRNAPFPRQSNFFLIRPSFQTSKLPASHPQLPIPFPSSLPWRKDTMRNQNLHSQPLLIGLFCFFNSFLCNWASDFPCLFSLTAANLRLALRWAGVWT